ncbi:Bug family tripartite tricarboxylate transporter substrate binding protein [Hydrogenophaga sp. PBL-H3]|uniref:Bug family tripartite tricarboxylate transporter substrate binding protein n=1 Tax=Hydrogenophaga sp. PBL-H3 TaxID=434010 RepID=UPI00131FF847|nr:tripartite tricarboxylate transporter substrate binding protein [Hydrogenophaga sp. PBL-H3]QHE74911.1 tripartite tricarboxylate transporter substrate binding protein [Hydrogenophaga sp. PBL-H3]QHE79338.1 tripartite tricarboxylate transporter substrate binding protein [Hydrogenophaga sp. PBL-H3]
MTIQHPVSRRRFNAVIGACLALPLAARAQAYPAKPIRILVPFAAGGPTDLMARAVGKSLSTSLGQPVIVENKPGGGGVIAMGEVARSPADGYTLVFPSILAVTNPALMANYPFDTLRDFSPLTVVGYIPHALVVRPDFAAKDLPALVAMAKASPGSINYGSSGNGTSAHLGAALFAQRADIKVTHVPYRGAAPAVQDLLGGQIQFMFLDMSSALAQIKAGKLRALAVAPARRFAGLPDVPTVAEQGYPGFDVHGWYGLFARSGTPAPVMQTLYAEVKKALDSAEIRDLFENYGIEAGGMTPEQYTELVRKDLGLWKRTVDQLGITLQ